ncbi:winged helix-turn-helix domain-containing protein [Kribbella hippodromi]|uniref:Winged helix-turn-helix domain-containing protein n=1 Tax=Kribbella hippodromi TaxID=434347 RepID=A0ABP4PVH5_9ACTN
MTLLRLNSLALSRSRFALSPLAETVGAIISLRRGQPDPWLYAWYRRHQLPFNRRLEQDPFLSGLADLLSATKWLPDVVVLPPSGGMNTALADELDPMLTMTDREICAGLEVAIEHCWIDHDPSWIRGRDLGTRFAAVLQSVWNEYVAPDWPRRRRALEQEVIYRAGLLAAYGWPRALDGMSSRSKWIGADSIKFSGQSGADVHVGDEGLQFVPVTLRGGTWLCESVTRGYALVYPARRAATESTPDARLAVEQLIGRGRTRILEALARPASVTDLAETLDLSLGTVGRHLRILRNANLITAHKMIYHQTPRANALLEPPPTRPDPSAVPPTRPGPSVVKKPSAFTRP